MSTQYREMFNGNMNDGFSNILHETSDFFKSEHRMNILGEGFKDVMTDPIAFNDYVEKLTEGLNPTEARQMTQLFENAKMQTLHESVAGIQPHASLTMPVIRKMWARIALKYAIPTEPVKVPAFSVAFTSPYVLQPDGTKKPLPESINAVGGGRASRKHVENTMIGFAADAAGAAVGQPMANGSGMEGLVADGGVITLMPNVEIYRRNQCAFKDPQKLDPIHHKLDKMTMISSLVVDGEIVPLNLKADLYGRLFAEKDLFGAEPDGTVKGKVTIIGNIDFEKCCVMLFSKVQDAEGAVQDVEVQFAVQGFFTHETHNESVNVAIDIFKRDIEIGTGTHIENSLQLEFLQDAMAMYNIDGAAETIDVMSNVIAQKLDIEIYEFLADSFTRTQYAGGAAFQGQFNLQPSIGYNGSPKDWREELKVVIDYFALKMKSTKFFYNGYFAIIGNPLDTMLLPNVSWTFSGIQEEQNGVEVEYSVGAMSGSQRYTVVASDLIPQGALLMFFVPTTNKYITYKYYPYTFNVVQDYRNALINNVPSVMMTKRHTIEEFTPLICKIDIIGNDGHVPQWGTMPGFGFDGNAINQG